MCSIEDKRSSNIADNALMLKQLMSDLQNMEGILPPSKITQRPKMKRRESDGGAIRRNPSRTTRYEPLTTRSRSRRGSISSTSSHSSSSSSSPTENSENRLVVRFGAFMKRRVDVDDDDYDDDDKNELGVSMRFLENKRVARRSREIKPADQITEEDLKMVADTVKDKHYDSVYGTTCHQCRQKTFDQKTICRSENCSGVRGQFCGPCLRNRYGEDAREALSDANWECPPCRGECNCSFCRKKKGKASTGILIHSAKENGFDNVKSYLESLVTPRLSDI